MATLDPIPQARVVKNAGQLVAPPRPPRTVPGPISEHLRTAAAVALGLWPLTAVVMLLFALLYFAGMRGSP